MNRAPHKRIFTAERQMRERTGLGGEWSDDFFDPSLAPDDDDGMGGVSEATPMEQIGGTVEMEALPAPAGMTYAPAPAGVDRSDEILAELKALRADIADGRLVSTEKNESESQAEQDLVNIRTQIAQMAQHIEQAKVQIASLRHPKADDDRLMAAANELDAIVKDTEMATHDILESAEAVDDLAQTIRNSASDDFIKQNSEQIAFIVTKIFESCNFQDITGQRINKVVHTLQFIEERVHNMIDIWGAEAFADLPMPEQADIPEDTDLLNGPQLEGEGISQDDIDKLFD